MAENEEDEGPFLSVSVRENNRTIEREGFGFGFGFSDDGNEE